MQCGHFIHKLYGELELLNVLDGGCPTIHVGHISHNFAHWPHLWCRQEKLEFSSHFFNISNCFEKEVDLI